MEPVYRCVCCQLEGRARGLCSCVFSPCYRCVKCCVCPEKFVRRCSGWEGLDNPERPFAEFTPPPNRLP